MRDSVSGHLGIVGTVLLSVYAQLVLKWRSGSLPPLPADWTERLLYLLRFLFDPWILSCFGAGFTAFLCWVGALRQFDLSYAYPFIGASFVLVLWMSVALLDEPPTTPRVLGTLLIAAGIVVGSRG